MPKFKPETLENVETLYLNHLGYIPLLIKEADQEMQSLQREDLAVSPPSFFAPSNKPRVTPISKAFIFLLRNVISSPLLDALLKREYDLPTLLIFREFGDWLNTRSIENTLHEIVDVERRVSLFEALFVAGNLLEISPLTHRFFTLNINHCKEKNKDTKDALDIYDLNKLIMLEAETLLQHLREFNKCYPVSNQYTELVSNNFDKAIEDLNNDLDNLSKIFNITLQRKAFIDIDLQEMRAYLELIVRQMAGIKERMVTISCYHQCNSDMQNEVGIDISQQINSSILRITFGVDIIKRQIGPNLYAVNGILKYKFLDTEEEPLNSIPTSGPAD